MLGHAWLRKIGSPWELPYVKLTAQSCRNQTDLTVIPKVRAVWHDTVTLLLVTFTDDCSEFPDWVLKSRQMVLRFYIQCSYGLKPRQYIPRQLSFSLPYVFITKSRAGVSYKRENYVIMRFLRDPACLRVLPKLRGVLRS